MNINNEPQSGRKQVPHPEPHTDKSKEGLPQAFPSPRYQYLFKILRHSSPASSSVANRKLLIGGTSITQTAELLGFDYPQHFTRVFKKFYGVSPTAYLKQMSK